ncbi:NAD(P)/FAD-dependent oxidoreductase [Actinomadura sp. DC4]|uniref:NAD(P)/FAD-dependent oxidoreductase n=1 Tax=Actinomadura sp. DC4 TaxID=3055069 RepID=UPI0025B1EFCC|nr:NAD(P)/FAD-dependent oxidoreductase [Actinomadura sp. DC4]MDN3354461.1 NAD(P)/FAD-dependent oxidoreductase [Actinomadura sp. DC4]
MSESREDCDVLVVGGGPAGSCAAGLLASRGVSVTLIEGARFPRSHIGESLLAMSMPYLRSWGVGDIVDGAGFVLKSGAIFRWGGQKNEMRLGMPHPGYAYQVSRDEFDDLLLRRAEAAGVRVERETWARELSCDGAGDVDGVLTQEGTLKRRLRAKYVIDASGLFQFVPRSLGLPSADDGHQRVAVGAYYEGAGRTAGDRRNDIITEAADDSWLWFIPLSDEITSVGMVTDADLVEHRHPQKSIDQAIGETHLIRGLLETSRPARRGRLLRYTNHVVTAPMWDRGYVLVGDSAMFVDPLFSTGVHGALLSASHAAAALVSVLAGDVPDEQAAHWYDREMRRHYERVNETVRVLYGVHPGKGRFWARRDLTGLDDEGAEAICRRLGAVGAKFFLDAHRDEGLRMPETLTGRLSEFHVDIGIARCRESAVPSLADEVSRTGELAYKDGTVAPGVVLSHARNRTVRPAYQDGSLIAGVCRAVDGRTTVGQIARRLSTRPADHAVCASAIGTLQRAGLIRA